MISRQFSEVRKKRKVQQTAWLLNFLAERMGFKPMCDCSQTDFESSVKKRTWRNLTEDNGRCENPENTVFSRLSTPFCIENAVKIRFRRVLTDFRESLLEFLIEPSVFSPQNNAFGSAEKTLVEAYETQNSVGLFTAKVKIH